MCVCDTLIYNKLNERKSRCDFQHMRAFTFEFVSFYFVFGRRVTDVTPPNNIKKKPESGSIRELCSSKSLTYLYIYKHHFECQKIEWWSIHFMNEQMKASRWIVKMKSLHTIANVRVIVTWYAIMCNMILLLFCVLWYFKCANVYTHIF